MGVYFSKASEQMDELLSDHSDGDDFEWENFSDRKYEDNFFEHDFHIKSQDEQVREELSEK